MVVRTQDAHIALAAVPELVHPTGALVAEQLDGDLAGGTGMLVIPSVHKDLIPVESRSGAASEGIRRGWRENDVEGGGGGGEEKRKSEKEREMAMI